VAEIYDQHQDFDRVVGLLWKRTRLVPNDPTAHRLLGLVQSRLGRRSEAFVELAVADLLGGADAESLSTLGRLHLAANRVDDAAAVARRAVDMQPELQGPRYVLGRVLMRQGHADEAREQFTVFQHIRDRTMDDQRRSFEVDKLRTVAARQAEAGLWHDVASTWVRIVEQMPGVPEFRVAAGAALAAIGALPEAAEHLEEAAVLGAGPDAQRRLAEVYANLGRQADSDRARESYERQVKELLRAAPRTAP
jgi:tetratricopeptide (TPR) repeat protein